MTLASSISSVSWEFVTRHPGILLVLIGVAGEVIFDWERKKGFREAAKKFFACVLVIGLAWEIWEAVESDKQSAETNERAGIANKLAAESNERSKQLEAQNLVLRSNVAALEIKLQPRKISKEQRELFISLLKNAPKGEIRVAVRNLPPETIDYTSAICDMVEAAGYKIAKGVEKVPNFITVERPPSLSVYISTYEERPKFSDALVYAFKTAIDPTVGTHQAPTNIVTLELKSNELVIFINEKVY